MYKMVGVLNIKLKILNGLLNIIKYKKKESIIYNKRE